MVERVHSDKMVLVMLWGEGGWSGRAVAQRRPRVSKLGLKGLFDYYSNLIAVEAARQVASGLDKRASLKEYLLKKRELDNSSRPNRTRQKTARHRKIPLVRKSYSLPPGKDAKGS